MNECAKWAPLSQRFYFATGCGRNRLPQDMGGKSQTPKTLKHCGWMRVQLSLRIIRNTYITPS
jgi:hypothetical protein